MAAAVAPLAMLDGQRDQSERTRRHFGVCAETARRHQLDRRESGGLQNRLRGYRAEVAGAPGNFVSDTSCCRGRINQVAEKEGLVDQTGFEPVTS